MARPINVVIGAQTDQLIAGLGSAERAVSDSARVIETSTDKIDDAYASVADSADTVASRGAQLSGALGGLSGVAASAGGPFAALGGAMEGASVAAQAFADAGDLVNFVTDLGIGKQTLLKAQTIATTAAQKGAAAASKAWTVAQGALNVVLSANPIGLVVLAVAALVAGFVIAYKKSDTFREIVDKAFSKIKSVAQDVAGFFTTNVPAAFQKVTDAAGKVPAFFEKIKDTAADVIKDVKDKFGDMVDFFKGLPGEIGGIFTGLWSGIAGTLADALNNVLGLPLKIPEIDTKIPGVGKIGGQTLIPELAEGGIVTKRTLAIIGEAGPEAVIPLNGKYGVGGGDVNITVVAPVGSSPADIGRGLRDYLDAYAAPGGRRVAF